MRTLRSRALGAVIFAAAFGVAGCDDGGSGGDSGTRPGSDGGGTMTGACEGGPLAEPIPGCMPTAAATSGDLAQDCVDRINQFRAECQCLGPLMRWTEGEACADQQAEYDSGGRAPHSGWSERICDPRGSAQNECPGWGGDRQVISQCLQLMWDEGPGEPFSEHGHYLNMSNTGFTRVACGFHTTGDGQVWAVQNFQ